VVESEAGTAATERLARFVVETHYDRLPKPAVEAAKIAIMDGVGVMVAGSAQAPARIAAAYAHELGGAPRCSVVGAGFKTNAPSAAFANGVAGHCLDFCRLTRVRLPVLGDGVLEGGPA
jgi:2-methylcitrate dehydratase PrpD